MEIRKSLLRCATRSTSTSLSPQVEGSEFGAGKYKYSEFCAGNTSLVLQYGAGKNLIQILLQYGAGKGKEIIKMLIKVENQN